MSTEKSMTLKELCERLDIDIKDPDACITVYINGIEQEFEEIPPIWDFEVYNIDVKLDKFPHCEVTLYV